MLLRQLSRRGRRTVGAAAARWSDDERPPTVGAAAVLALASPAAALSPAAVKALSAAPPLAFFAMQAAGFPTVRRIQRERSVGDLTPLPFVSLYTNCAIWTLYGLFQADPTIIGANAPGIAAGLYYTSVYARNSEASLRPYYAGSAGVLGAVAAAAVALEPETAATAIGLTGSTAAVLLMASPLATLRTVIRDKSSAALPLPTSLATFVNAASWSLYGLLVAADPLVWVPNCLGLAASGAQLGLIYRYRP